MNRTSGKPFQALIQPFSLPIRLRMVRGAHHQLSISFAEYFLLECACKYPVSVKDDDTRQSVQLIHIVHVDLSHM